MYDSLKGEQFHEVRSALEMQFRRHREDISYEQLNEMTQIALDVGAVDFAEIYGRQRFQERAQDFGLRIGFVVDLQSGWNLNQKKQIEQVEFLLEDEDPIFLLSSPPSKGFEELQKDQRGCMRMNAKKQN